MPSLAVMENGSQIGCEDTALQVVMGKNGRRDVTVWLDGGQAMAMNCLILITLRVLIYHTFIITAAYLRVTLT